MDGGSEQFMPGELLTDSVGDSQAHLVETLQSGHAVLIAGSGCSAIVDYPLWDGFVRDLRDTLSPEDPDPTLDQSPMSIAQRVKERLWAEKRETEYSKFLERSFDKEAGSGHPHDPVHEAIVQLGFCALCTTNYDEVLEDACISIQRKLEEVAVPSCHSLDLCDDTHRWRLIPFLRRLVSKQSVLNEVLHIHGFFRSPENMVVTADDYARRYGYRVRPSGATEPLITLHRKVLWSLASNHPLVFLGFSLDDPYFQDILSMVSEDFGLQGDLVHFAIYGATKAEEGKAIANLARYGTEAVFYEVIESPKGRDHSALSDLIFTLADQVGIDIRSISASPADKLRSMTRQFAEDGE